MQVQLSRAALGSVAVLGLLVAALPAIAQDEAPGEAQKEAPQEVEEEAPAEGATESSAAEDPTLAAVDGFIATREIDRSDPRWKEKVPPPPKLQFDKARRYVWELETNRGRLAIRLYPDAAPVHVSSTIYLTRLGFFDSLVFHRVITGFMAQGGDPRGNGTGDPGYEYAGEISDSLSHDRRGLLSMANAGPGTDGSQFFITFAPTPHLDGKHTIFGEVTGGMRTLDRIEKLGRRSGRPKQVVMIEKASIRVEPVP